MNVNGKEYEIIELLGHGKGGYSYLVTDGENEYVLKQIYHEPCAYYQFGNKMEAEKNDYKRLCETGILIPKLLDIDEENERILKEYIKGSTIYELVLNDKIYYIDYECNDYMEEWNFENWGIKYYSKTPEFLSYAQEH